jgi:hypothetical protein
VKSIVDIADYVNVLDDGRIVYSATRDAFLASSHPLAHHFVSASGVILPGQPEREDRVTPLPKAS